MIRNHALLKLFMNDYPSRESGMSLIKPILAIYTSGISRPENLISDIPGFPVQEGDLNDIFSSAGKVLLTFYKLKKFLV
jgi:hypothetical protein